MLPLAAHDRPREKLERTGASALGDNELVAIVIGHGNATTGDALGLANRLLTTAGGLHGLTRIGCADLARTPGIGGALASRLVAAVELGRRTLVTRPPDRPRFATSAELARFLLPQFGAAPVERFGVVLLDTRHRLIAARLISIGTCDASLAHPRDVFREALLGGASAVVAFHNHPSGDPSPSPDDLALTRRLAKAGGVMGIELVDHLILADLRYCSLRESGVV
jgi:DNA repair protein RadC